MMLSKPTYDRLRKVSLIRYGRLYNWPAAAHANIAPAGWSVPTDANFTTLTDYIDTTYNVAPNDFGVANHLKHRRQISSPLGGEFATSTQPRWASDATEYGRDSVLFGALPGAALGADGSFITLDFDGFWWSSTERFPEVAWGRRMRHDDGNVNRLGYNKVNGFSIRCFRTAATWEQDLPDGAHRGQVQDIDGNIYDTVKIGTQVWMVQSLATTRLNDGTPITLVTSGAMSDSVANYANYDNDTANVYFTSHLDSIWKPKDFIIP